MFFAATGVTAMRDLLAAEWLKLRTTRLLHAGVPLAVGLSVAAVAGSVLATDRAGIALAAGEYRHGTAADTFLTTPRRQRVVAAKLAMAAALGAAIGAITAAACAGAAAALFHLEGTTLPFDDGAVCLTLAGAVVYTILFAVLGVALGTLIRNQLLAVAVALAWIGVVEHVLVNLAPSVGRWLPTAAGLAIVRAPLDGILSPLGGAAVLAAYAAVNAPLARTKHSVQDRCVTERTESYGVGLAELMNPEVARRPQPVYALLQDSSPVFRLHGVGVIVCSRAGVDEVLRDPETFSSSTAAHDLKARRPLIPLQIDPPDHRRYRKILDPLFAPARMRQLEAATGRLVNELVDGFVGEHEIDFARRFSTPFPSQVFLTLFGLPLAELPRFLQMKDGVIRPDRVVGHEFGHPETEAHQQRTADAIYGYFEGVLDERAAGAPRDDLLGHFLGVEVDGVRLTREEILDICFLFLIAGLDTVTASLDCIFAHLAEHPDVRRTIVERPDAVPGLVEEMLRWETPVMGCARVATRDVEVAGFAVGAGEQVMALLGAANVDGAEFPDADALRWDREVNRHLAFGGGIHRCLGSHLARLELRVALREWHRCVPDYRITPGVDLDFSAGIRTLDSFPMVLGPAT
jgi:cytochrome P450